MARLAEGRAVYVLAHAVAPVVPVLLLRWARPRAALARLSPAWLAFGGLLPDVVDKPLGHLVTGHGHGRLWMHTLLAGVLFVLLALAAWRAGPRVGLAATALALGVASHLVLDAMWGSPRIFLWPLLGPMPVRPYDPMRYVTVVAEPGILQSEAIAAVALAAAWAGARTRQALARRPRRAGRGRAAGPR